MLSLPPQPAVVAVPRRAVHGEGRLCKLIDGRMRRLAVAPVGAHRDDAGRRFELVRSEQLQDGGRIVVTQLPVAIGGLPVKTAEQAP